MPIQLDTQLMPQYLPGGVSTDACSRVEMVAADDHRVIAFTLNEHRHLTVWLSAEEGFVRWLPITVSLSPGEVATVIDFDVIGNVGQGRCDGTVDLALIAERPDGERCLFHWPRMPALAAPEAWRLSFAAAQPVTLPHAIPLEAVRLGVMPHPVRCLIVGACRTPPAWALFRVSTDAGGRVCTGLDPFALPDHPADAASGGAVLAAAVGKRVDAPALEDGALVAVPHPLDGWTTVSLLLPGSAPDRMPRSWPVRAVDSSVSWPPGLNHMQTVLDADLGGASFLFSLAGDGLGNATIGLFDVMDRRWATGLRCSCAGLVPATGPLRVVPPVAGGQAVQRFERMHRDGQGGPSAQLVLTTGLSLRDPAAASVPLFDDVTAFCACRCGTGRDEPTSLHVMVAYAGGGLELFTQDSVSGQGHPQGRAHRRQPGPLALPRCRGLRHQRLRAAGVAGARLGVGLRHCRHGASRQPGPRLPGSRNACGSGSGVVATCISSGLSCSVKPSSEPIDLRSRAATGSDIR